MEGDSNATDPRSSSRDQASSPPDQAPLGAQVRSTDADPTDVDVLIVGAGLSGIGAACHLRRTHPDKTFAILEAREASGGTWDLFRYPGIRSDSDMFTLGYSFRPWEADESIADGPAILEYVRETAREHDVERHIRFGHRVVDANWSSETARWTVTAKHTRSNETVTLTAGFLWTCTGYYRYDEGYTPEFAGREDFAGQIIHPQHWPEDFDWSGKRVVVIGSGATAVTLVPALAEQAEHVTMLQRSPSYVLSIPGRDAIAARLRDWLPSQLAYQLTRVKNVGIATGLFTLSRRFPAFVRRRLRGFAERQLPEDVDVDTHFNPRYDPWDQRLCFVPDGDLFTALRRHTASIVTDEIDRFTEHGIQLRSGTRLDADVIVTATGLNLLVLGGMRLSVDGTQVDPADTVAYKGMMLSGVPNMALTLGYTNASWTLKADLVAAYVCRLLGRMDEQDTPICTPTGPDPSAPTEPIIDLRSGYVLRSLDRLPRQGATAPWRLHQNWLRDLVLMRRGPLDDGVTFSRPVPRSEPEAPPPDIPELAAA